MVFDRQMFDQFLTKIMICFFSPRNIKAKLRVK